jgi:UDP-N-acetylmuramoyl-tripeptide--D-alanyl-D-alanine ligase
MDPLTLGEIAVMCGAAAPTANPRATVTRVCKDTRTLAPGDLYLALRGEHFDGNAFAAEAFERGAAAAILDDPSAARALPAECPVLLVGNAVDALHRMASAWRSRLGARVVCVTGSNGKTGTKDFTMAVLGTTLRTGGTSGNLNNHLGLPLSILSASLHDEALVWEIGMNHPGEIAPLAALARPDVGIVTNTGVAHIEFLGSKEAIAREKARLLESLPPGGTAIFPAHDAHAPLLASSTRAAVTTTGGADSTVRARDITVGPEGTGFTLEAAGECHPVRLAVPGTHAVSNALLAAAAGLACQIAPAACARGLASASLSAGRLGKREIRGVLFLDDTYNANPDSMVAALDVLGRLPARGRKIAVLGPMGELGSHADGGYRRVGAAAGAVADLVIVVGTGVEAMAGAARAGAGVRAAADTASACDLLKTLASPGDLVLVKGSRSARMETIIRNF